MTAWFCVWLWMEKCNMLLCTITYMTPETSGMCRIWYISKINSRNLTRADLWPPQGGEQLPCRVNEESSSSSSSSLSWLTAVWVHSRPAGVAQQPADFKHLSQTPRMPFTSHSSLLLWSVKWGWEAGMGVTATHSYPPQFVLLLLSSGILKVWNETKIY